MVEKENNSERLGFVTNDLRGAIKVIESVWDMQSSIGLPNSSFTINSSGDNTEVITDSETMATLVLPTLHLIQINHTLKKFDP